MQRSEDASPSDGGQGHRGPEPRLFPEGSGQGGAGEQAGRTAVGSGGRETRFRDRDGAESRVHPQRRGDGPREPSPTRDAPRTPETAPAALGLAAGTFRFRRETARPRRGGLPPGREGAGARHAQAPERVAGPRLRLCARPCEAALAAEVRVTTRSASAGVPLVLWAARRRYVGVWHGSAEVMGGHRQTGLDLKPWAWRSRRWGSWTDEFRKRRSVHLAICPTGRRPGAPSWG